jgi:methyl-accepting chemotaxis protein
VTRISSVAGVVRNASEIVNGIAADIDKQSSITEEIAVSIGRASEEAGKGSES